MPSSSRRSAPLTTRRDRPNQLLVAIVLVAIGGIVALSFDRLGAGVAQGGGGVASPGSSALNVADPSADPGLTGDLASGDLPSDAPLASDGPSPSPAAPILDAELPREVNGTPLTVETDLGSTILGNDPGSRSFAAAVSTLGVSPDKIEIGFSYDETGALALTVLGFRIPGVTAAKLQPLVLESWLSSTAPGVKSASLLLSGLPATRVSYGDKGADEYVFIHGDGVFIVETSDQTLATAIVKTMASEAQPSSAPASEAQPSSAPASEAQPSSAPAS